MDSRKNKEKSNPYELLMIGKVPPQNIEAEEVILGALLAFSTNASCQKILQSIKSEHFYKFEHQIICKNILSLWQEDAPIDIITVTDRLRHAGEIELVGGPFTVQQLTDRIKSPSNVEYWFYNILYPAFLKREIIRVGLTAANEAYEDTLDTFDQLDKLLGELEKCKPEIMFKPSHSAKSVGEEFRQEMGLMDEKQEDQPIKYPIKKYPIGSPQFDDIVSICKDKIILFAGHKASLKSRLSNFIVTTLAELYPDIAVYWVSLEDSAAEQLRIYLSRKIKIIPEKIKFRLFDSLLRPNISKWVKKWESFDFKIRDQAMKIKDIGTSFKIFCAERPEKLCILIIDNVLSLADFDDFRNLNDAYDYIGRNILNIKRETHALVLPVHHFNDEASSKQELPNGYRPRLKDMKGTEVWRRIAYQTVLINKPSYYKDLMAEYKGDHHEILKYLWIMDVGTNRAHKELDESSLLRFFVEPDYCMFLEVNPNFEFEEEIVKEKPSEVTYF